MVRDEAHASLAGTEGSALASGVICDCFCLELRVVERIQRCRAGCEVVDYASQKMVLEVVPDI